MIYNMIQRNHRGRLNYFVCCVFTTQLFIMYGENTNKQKILKILKFCRFFEKKIFLIIKNIKIPLHKLCGKKHNTCNEKKF